MGSTVDYLSLRWSASKCLQKSGVCINVILSRHENRSWRNNKCRQFNMKVSNAMPSKCVHLQQRSTSVSRHVPTKPSRHKKSKLYTASETNFHQQNFSPNQYVIIFQRKDFSAIFFFSCKSLKCQILHSLTLLSVFRVITL